MKNSHRIAGLVVVSMLLGGASFAAPVHSTNREYCPNLSQNEPLQQKQMTLQGKDVGKAGFELARGGQGNGGQGKGGQGSEGQGNGGQGKGGQGKGGQGKGTGTPGDGLGRGQGSEGRGMGPGKGAGNGQGDGTGTCVKG